MPTNNTLLALTLGDSPLVTTALYDPASSLPTPHITLLHGFAELTSQESRDEALQTVAQLVAQNLSTSGKFGIPFCSDSLTVFEHRASASLVCTPDGSCRWLRNLYESLRAAFRFCDEQESRFVDGWTPHVSLGKFDSESDVRKEANRMATGSSWFQQRGFLHARAVVLYRRDVADGQFYPICTVPLEKKPSNVLISEPSEFLEDAGAALASHFSKQSEPFVSGIERACQATIAALTDGQLEVTLTRYGSCTFQTSLPTISDIDAVISISPQGGRQNVQGVSTSAYLVSVASRIRSIYPGAIIRMRTASPSGRAAVHLLTAKLTPQAPPVDLVVSRESATTKASIQDSRLLLDHVRAQATRQHSADYLAEVFEGALRLCRLWAYRRQVYGAPLGFLGGGGWALLLARTLSEGSG